jgi:hypothetical protein
MLDRIKIESLLGQIGEAAVDDQRRIPFGLIGGSALVLGTDFRRLTGDIDYAILTKKGQSGDRKGISSHKSFLRGLRIPLAIQNQRSGLSLPELWLSESNHLLPARFFDDPLKYFSAERHYGSHPTHGLDVYLLKPTYQLLFKQTWRRPKDDADIISLCRQLGITRWGQFLNFWNLQKKHLAGRADEPSTHVLKQHWRQLELLIAQPASTKLASPSKPARENPILSPSPFS